MIGYAEIEQTDVVEGNTVLAGDFKAEVMMVNATGITVQWEGLEGERFYAWEQAQENGFVYAVAFSI